MPERTVIDYPCAECGLEGPHSAHYDEDLRQWVAECGECLLEFGVPEEALSG